MPNSPDRPLASRYVSGEPPWSREPTWLAPPSRPVSDASWVCSPTIWLEIQIVMTMMNVPEMRVRNMLPLWTPTAMATKKPMVARSPNGRTVLPGMRAARMTVHGMKMREAEMTCGWPRSRAGSRPMRNSPLENRFCRIFLAESATGMRPCMMSLTTMGMSNMTAPISTASLRESPMG